MTDKLGKYLGLPPIGAVEDAEIVEDKPVPKKMSADASHLSKKL